MQQLDYWFLLELQQSSEWKSFFTISMLNEEADRTKKEKLSDQVRDRPPAAIISFKCIQMASAIFLNQKNERL